VSVRLALETATRVGSIAIGRGEAAEAAEAADVEVNLSIQETHSEVLLPAVDFSLAMAGAALSDVREIVVGTGPGSFTGVRVAAAIAKGWSFAADVTLYGYPTLLVIAAAAAVDERPICALLDARRGEVYAAGYRLSDATFEPWLPPGVFDLRELGRRLRDLDERPLCVGPGAEAYRAALSAASWPVAAGPTVWPRAATLLWLRARWPAAGAILDPNQWEPLYVRDSGARARHETAR
jgi:tRNA threonylcarbamoyladenosine biosynthesis protein TsaB